MCIRDRDLSEAEIGGFVKDKTHKKDRPVIKHVQQGEMMGMMELVRPESMQPQASQRSVLGADTSAATRGLPDWRQDEEETRAKHHSSLASQASLSPRRDEDAGRR